MNIGLYQSATSLSALERWQDAVAQNITSSQQAGYRKQTVEFDSIQKGAHNTDQLHPNDPGASQPALFPRIHFSQSFELGETQPTGRDLDLAIQGKGFFELQTPDGGKAYTRAGAFRIDNDFNLVSGNGLPVLTQGGSPITTIPGGGPISVGQDGSISQGNVSLGRIGVADFADTSNLKQIATGVFKAGPNDEARPLEKVQIMQGYIENSNVSPLREMVDLVVISRAYEANQRIIRAVDENTGKALEALG